MAVDAEETAVMTNRAATHPGNALSPLPGQGREQEAYQFESGTSRRARQAGRTGRARIDQVARLERDVPADPTDGLGNAMNHVPRALLLLRPAVLAELQLQVVIVETGDDERAAGAERLAALGPPPLPIVNQNPAKEKRRHETGMLSRAFPARAGS